MAKKKQTKVSTNKIDFVYTITNNGKTIHKDFKGKGSPEDVVLTLLSALISDVKNNIDKKDYEKMLDFIGTQYAKELLPELIEGKQMSEEKKEVIDNLKKTT